MDYEPGTWNFWWYNVLIAFNQFVNALHGGWADETICSRAWRNRGRYPYKVYVVFLDWLFGLWQGPGHTRRAYERERDRKHEPPELRAGA